MSRALIFWILMLVWFVFFLATLGGFMPLYVGRAGGLLEFCLFLLLGWQVYGKPVQ